MGHTIDQLNLATIPSQLEGICLFGGYDPALLPWLEENKERLLIVLFEEEKAFLHFKADPLAEHPQVRSGCYKKGNEEILKELAWEALFLRLGYFTLEGASQTKAEECFSLLDYYHQGVDLLASEYRDRGVKVLSNVLKNLSYLPASKQGLSLEGACRGMTAIVCGAGPSLNQVIPLLSSLQESALIIAGGSAVEALNKEGISPHLIAAVDPDPSHQSFLRQGSFETPLFYQSRFSPSLLGRMQGPLLWMSSQSLIPLESYVLSKCGLFSEPFDAGWTVANFCTALAVHLGCSRILFAGVDFVCSKDQVYASDLCGQKQRQSLIALEGDLCSRKDWLMSAEWTREFVAKHPAIEWFTLTKPALDLLQVPKLPSSATFACQKDLLSQVHALIMGAEGCAISPFAISNVRAELKRSFEKGLVCCKALLDIWQSAYPLSPLEMPEYLLLQHDLEQEICYEHCLAPLWEVWKYVILRTEPHPLGKQLHRLLFLKEGIEIHLSYLRSYS